MSRTALDLYLDMLYGAEPTGGWIEVRWRNRAGTMARDFCSVSDRRRAAELILARGAKGDVYCGVAPRARQEGTRGAIRRTHVLWADLDTNAAREALSAFSPPPGLVVASGSGWHAYWPLWPPLAGVAWIERANRRLAHALGADGRCTDASRILRPPRTHNFKAGEPVAVTIEHVCVTTYEAREVVANLPDPPEPERPAPRRALTATDDVLATIPAEEYLGALTGQEVGADGKLACPLPDHDDETPSLQVYDDGWFCFGCGRGGSIIDLGALLYGIEPRGRGYHEIRRRLAVDLLRSAA